MDYIAGFSGMFATGEGGTKDIAARIPGAIHHSSVSGYADWRKVFREIVDMRSDGQLGKVCLFGHSNGGYAVLKIAQELAKKRIIVDYLGIIDLTLKPSPAAGNNIKFLQEFHSAYAEAKLGKDFAGEHDFKPLDKIMGRNIGHSEAARLQYTQDMIVNTIAKIRGESMPEQTPFYMGVYDPLDDADFISLAKEYGLDEAHVRAVVEIESNGKGSWPGSGALVCLYEPHVAYRNTSGAWRNALVGAGIAYKSWKRNYPKTSFPRIDQCVRLVAKHHPGGYEAGVEIAALSTSWGLGQILGENYKLAGFPNAASMVREFAKGEYYQLKGMLEFIKNKGILDDLKAGRWVPFAEGYNGARQAEHNYSGRLRNAYARWVEAIEDRKDIPVIPDPVDPPEDDDEPISLEEISAKLDMVLAILEGEYDPPDIPKNTPETIQNNPVTAPGFSMPETKEETMQTEPKNFLQSTTIQGAGTVLFGQFLPTIAPLIGFEFTSEMGETVVTNISNILTSIGALMAIYGRLKAKQPISVMK